MQNGHFFDDLIYITGVSAATVTILHFPSAGCLTTDVLFSLFPSGESLQARYVGYSFALP